MTKNPARAFITMCGAISLFATQQAQAGIEDIFWTPTEIATVAWFDAADTNTLSLSGDKVTNWQDKSGNSNHAASSVANPTYIASDPLMNSMPCIFSSNGGQIGLLTPSMTMKHLYAVIYYGNGTETSFPSSLGWRSLLSNAGTSPHLMGEQGKSTWNTQIADSFYRNGSTTSSRTAIPMPASLWTFKNTSATVTHTFGIGYGSTSRGWNGGYSELIFTDGTEDLDTQQMIEGYLAWKWNLVGNLDADHPYKLKAPGAPPEGTVITLQ